MPPTSRRSTIIGGLWLLLGAVAAPWTTYDLWRVASDPEYGLSSTFYEPSFWVIQAVFPIFFVLVFGAGVGVLKNRRWGVLLLRVLAPVMLVYTAAYTLLDHDHYWWWGLFGLACLLLAGFSIAFAYASRAS